MATSHIGKTLYVATALPATNDSAGFEALTWVQIKGLQSAFQFGLTHAGIDSPDMQTGFTTGIKGAASGNDSQASFFTVASDAGQASAKTLGDALGTGANCSIKIGLGSGTAQALVTGDAVEYAQGYMHSYMETQPDVTTEAGFTVSFRQNAVSVKATEPV